MQICASMRNNGTRSEQGHTQNTDSFALKGLQSFGFKGWCQLQTRYNNFSYSIGLIGSLECTFDWICPCELMEIKEP